MSAAKIFIVDDDPDVGRLFKTILGELGYEVKFTITGRAGLAWVKRDPPDILFLDLKMPQMDGLECLRRIRQLNRKLPIVMLTGYGDLSSAQEAMRLGADEYLSKPFDLEQLKRLIAELLT